jgi:hypothetical protein
MKRGSDERQNGRLPDFIIIGATKAGTTSLDFYLSLHPEIHMARPKEPRFFIDAAEPMGRWGNGVDWYRGLFRSEKRICGEASPAYTHAPALPGVPERMARVVPEARLVYLVREPLERLKSHFLMQCRQKGESLGLADFLASNPEARCLLASHYGSQLQGYLDWFPSAQILVVESEELARNRATTLRRIFEFLGVDAGFSSPLFHHRRNVTGHQGIPNETGRRLLDSRVMTFAKASLPDSVFYHLRNLALTPFTKEPPSMNLSDKLRDKIHARFHSEMNLLRKQCSQALPSLGYE